MGGGGQPAWLRFMYYRTVERLVAGTVDRVFDAPHTLVPPGRFAEGTPNLYQALQELPECTGYHRLARAMV